MRSRPGLCPWPGPTCTSAAPTSLAFFSHAGRGKKEKFLCPGEFFHLPVVRALWSLLPFFWLFFNGFGVQRYWTLLFSFHFSWRSYRFKFKIRCFTWSVISILYFSLHILSPEFVQRVNRNSRAAIYHPWQCFRKGQMWYWGTWLSGLCWWEVAGWTVRS